MVRTQVYLTAKQHRALKREAARQGISMTELLRRLIDSQLSGRQGTRSFSKEAVMSFVGLGSSGQTDVSERHDAALDEALRDGSLR